MNLKDMISAATRVDAWIQLVSAYRYDGSPPHFTHHGLIMVPDGDITDRTRYSFSFTSQGLFIKQRLPFVNVGETVFIPWADIALQVHPVTMLVRYQLTFARCRGSEFRVGSRIARLVQRNLELANQAL